jgi:hypothetical protein
MDFLNQNNKRKPPAGTSPTLCNTWRNCQSVLLHNLFSTEDSDVGNNWIFSTFNMNAAFAKITDDFQDNLNGMMTSRRFQEIFKGKSLTEL